MASVPNFLSNDKLSTPRANGRIRYAHYFGFEGYAAASDDLTILFRTSGTLWQPVTNRAELDILAEVGDFEGQLALDTATGGLARIATSRQNLEVA